MNDAVDFTGLDYDFLRYIGVTPSVQRQNQQFYLPFFQGCQRVVDVGCGDGDFVELLREQGLEAFGVDNDPIAIQHLRERKVPAVEADVVAYLKSADPESLDGIFSAHLVEHLPYQAVYELIHYAYRALKPGGKIVLTTPNARALVSHLEMYWLHFGHVAFYHPRLLGFFLHRVGFQNETWGENPAPPHPLLGEPFTDEFPGRDLGIPVSGEFPGRGFGIPVSGEFPGSDFEIPVSWEAVPANRSLSKWRGGLRLRLARLLGLDDVVRQANIRFRQLTAQTNQLNTEINRQTNQLNTEINRQTNQLNTEINRQTNQLNTEINWLANRLASVMDRLDRPFECYVTAVKN